ncbi:MAG TPA: META domain-containing protein [Gammaproteobacteria bacterium]|nr:META domain-containing protein [Gammaproteobacteria bacterium]
MSGSGIRLRFAIGIFGALTLCSVAHSATLQGSEWTPLSLREVPLTATSPVFVQFASKGRLLGFGGCNRLFADYQTGAGNTIFIGPVAATRMACEEGVLAYEAEFAAALEHSRTYLRQQTRLTLFDSAGTPILELRQTDWD